MSLTARTIAAALALGFAAAAPQPGDGPRYHWSVAQDAGVPDASHSASDAGATHDLRAIELDRAMRAYEEASQRRLDATSSPSRLTYKQVP